MKCIAAIDQGTSSSRVLLINTADGSVVSSHQITTKQSFPSSGWVEQDPILIWNNVQQCLNQALHKANEQVSAGTHHKVTTTTPSTTTTPHLPGPIEVIAIGITNQRETTIVWNRHTGLPYHPAILWNDTRTQHIVERDLIDRIAAGDKDYFREKTGLPIATYFSASKLVYLLDLFPDTLARDAERGDALFGTVDTWLIWHLTNGKVHATDVTNASRTMLMNLRTCRWDTEILDMLKIPMKMLPMIATSASATAYGRVDTTNQHTKQGKGHHHTKLDPCYEGVPITGIVGDQQAALFGQACFQAGDVKCTYGTGAFLLANTGEKMIPSTRGLVTTVAYQLEDGPPIYALEGSVAYCGALINWLKDGLHLIHSAKDTEPMARSLDPPLAPDDKSSTGTTATATATATASAATEAMKKAQPVMTGNGGLYFVPAFAGLFAPHWQESARGAIVGLTAFHTKAHVVRASLEAAAFQTADVCAAMTQDLYDSGSAMKGKSKEVDEETALTSTSLPVTEMSTLWKEVKVDGGLASNDWLMQFQSNILDVPLVRPSTTETTALGATMVAGIGAGIWKKESEVKELFWKEDKVWTPSMGKQERATLMHNWDKAVARSLYWQDSVRFDGAGRCLLPADEVAKNDPYLAIMRRNNAVNATASLVKTSVKAKVSNAATTVIKKVVSPMIRYGSVFTVGLIVGYSIY